MSRFEIFLNDFISESFARPSHAISWSGNLTTAISGRLCLINCFHYFMAVFNKCLAEVYVHVDHIQKPKQVD